MRRCTVCLADLDDSEALWVQGHTVCRNCLSLSRKPDDPRLILLTLLILLPLLACAAGVVWLVTRG